MNERHQLGKNIRELRGKLGLQRADLAEALGAQEDYVASLEDGGVQPQVSELLKIAAALNTDMAALIYGREFGAKHATVTKADERVVIQRAHYLEYESLAPAYAGRHMEPFMVELRAASKAEYSTHVGEEFHFVLEGRLRIVVGREEHTLDPGDSIYFDSSLPHALSAETENVRLLAAIYVGETMLQRTRGRRMRDMVQAAKMTGGKNLAVVCPDAASMEAVKRAAEEGIVKEAWLFGDAGSLPEAAFPRSGAWRSADFDPDRPDFEERAAREAVAAVRRGDCQMLMKGRINTAAFARAILAKEGGIGTGRRLSLVSIFELPDVDRLIFLTDPGINPELFPGDDLDASVDIISNAIDVARSMGVKVPKVALLEANEVPSNSIPATVRESRLAGMEWKDALVDGPLSYDLALYRDAARKKGIGGSAEDSPVVGRADILVVPYISGGNFLYKAWAKTMGAEVANVVIGAAAPVALTSRSDSDKVKFLTLCACVLYAQHLAGA